MHDREKKRRREIVIAFLRNRSTYIRVCVHAMEIFPSREKAQKNALAQQKCIWCLSYHILSLAPWYTDLTFASNALHTLVQQ